MWHFDVFDMVVIVILVGAAEKVYKLKVMNHQSRQAMDSQNAALAERLDKLERRMANLETIVLDTEKKRNFERQL